MPRVRQLITTLLFLGMATVLLACSGSGSDPLDGTEWRLTGWSVSSQQASDFKVGLSFAGGELGGQAPVNSYGGTYETSGRGDFETGDINQTLMAGPEPAMRAEEAYFELLGQARSYSVDGDTLTLSDAAGNELLIFTAQ